jgi:hypothetical protein
MTAGALGRGLMLLSLPPHYLARRPLMPRQCHGQRAPLLCGVLMTVTVFYCRVQLGQLQATPS